jgi:SdrD B-like domain
MCSTTLSQWLNGLRAKSVRKPRRTFLAVEPLGVRTVPAVLAGSVFLDANNNGVRDCGEAGIAGVKVHLSGKTDCGQIVCKEAVTDCQGNYKFDGLTAGWYGVAEYQPAGFKDGKDSAGTAGGHVVMPNSIDCIRLENCTNASGYIFGERPACSNGSAGKGSGGKGSSGKGSGGKGSHDRCDSKQSHGKGSGGKGSNSKGSSGKGSGGKGSHDRCDSKSSHDKGSGGKGSHGKGSSGKGSGGKGSHDRCDDTVRTKGNNGVGNGLDGQPPGNPRVNDGPGTSPGNPGNKR